MTRYVARLFEAAETDCVVTMEFHDFAPFQNFYRCRTEQLETHGLFADDVARHWAEHDLTVVSSDVRGMGRAVQYREALESLAELFARCAGKKTAGLHGDRSLGFVRMPGGGQVEEDMERRDRPTWEVEQTKPSRSEEPRRALLAFHVVAEHEAPGSREDGRSASRISWQQAFASPPYRQAYGASRCRHDA
jgi:hypothetical protein